MMTMVCRPVDHRTREAVGRCISRATTQRHKMRLTCYRGVAENYATYAFRHLPRGGEDPGRAKKDSSGQGRTTRIDRKYTAARDRGRECRCEVKGAGGALTKIDRRHVPDGGRYARAI